MTDRVILYGAEPAQLEAGDITGHTLLRLAYTDGVTDISQWLDDAIAAWVAMPNPPHELRAVVLRYTARPTGAALGIRDAMLERTKSIGARLVFVVPSAELTWAQNQIAANPSVIRTYATTVADMQAWMDAHTWATPLDPALGGAGRRIGGGRHAPWGLCVDDPTSDPRTA